MRKLKKSETKLVRGGQKCGVEVALLNLGSKQAEAVLESVVKRIC